MTDQRRRVLSTILGVAGAILLLVGGFALYARQELFNSDNFSQTAAKSLRDEPVREALARPIVEQIVNVGPDQLINVQPLLAGAVSGVLETNAFKDVFQNGVRKAHKALFDKDGDQLVLTLKDANLVIVSAVRSVNPKVAKQIPDDVGQRLVRITNSKIALTGARWAERARFLGLLLPPLGILMLAGSVWLAPERRRALVNCLFGVAAAGAVGFIALLVARTLLLRNFSEGTTHDAVAALYDNYMGGLGTWMLLGGVLAVALAAAAATREPEPFERLRRVIVWFGRAPGSAWARAGRALAMGIAGIVALLEPTLSVQIVAVLLGAVAIYYAVVELIATIAPVPTPAEGRAKGSRKQLPPAASWRTPALAGATIIAAAIAVAFVITDQDKKKVVRPAGAPSRTATATPSSATAPSVTSPSRRPTTRCPPPSCPAGTAQPAPRDPAAAADGVRAFLIDTHTGSGGQRARPHRSQQGGREQGQRGVKRGARRRGRKAVPRLQGQYAQRGEGGRAASTVPRGLRARLDEADHGARVVQ